MRSKIWLIPDLIPSYQSPEEGDSLLLIMWKSATAKCLTDQFRYNAEVADSAVFKYVKELQLQGLQTSTQIVSEKRLVYPLNYGCPSWQNRTWS